MPTIQFRRYHMKREWLRIVAAGPHYRAFLTDRWPSLRLMPPGDGDTEISYASFGCFEAGQQDWIGHHLYRLPIGIGEPAAARAGRDGKDTHAKPLDDATLWPAGEKAETLADPTDGSRLRLIFNGKNGGERLFLDYHFLETGVRLRVEIERERPPGPSERLFVDFGGRLIYPRRSQGGGGAAYFSPGAGNGLAVRRVGEETITSRTIAPGDTRVTVRGAEGSASLECFLEPLAHPPGAGFPEDGAPRAGPATPGFAPVEERSIPAWEPEVVRDRGWRTAKERVGQRVAGFFVSVPEWADYHATSADPGTHLPRVRDEQLPRVLESGAFDVIGLSRDGIWELGYHASWLELVEQAHAAGHPVILKPGDQELKHVLDRGQEAAWARACFDQPAERRSDGVRLCWEAVLWAWTTADLCVPPDLFPDSFADLPEADWPTAEKAVVDKVAAQFDRLIRLIRSYAPETRIDLECGDTRVFRRLLEAHPDLGVMYMCYGEYPRVTDYLDLYYGLARHGLNATRVVLETDCYFCEDNPEDGPIRDRPLETLYSPEVVARIAAKHRHMNALPADAAWAWGININWTREKFEAIRAAAPGTGDNTRNR